MLDSYDKKFICWYMLLVQEPNHGVTIQAFANSLLLFGPLDGIKTLDKIGVIENR